MKDSVLDGMRLMEDITYPDSMGKEFYALPDGSWLYLHDGVQELRGEAWRIADGAMEKFSENGEVRVLRCP